MAVVDYFSTGCRPFLVQYPPWVAHMGPRTSPSPSRRSHKEGGHRDGCGGAWLRAASTVSGSTAEGCGESESWATSSSRQVTDPTPPRAPRPLHSAFDPADVQPWEEERFEPVGKVQDAVRNRGQVLRMRDLVDGRCVAVKQMPNEWVCKSHTAFMKEHPAETEHPWQDIGCTVFLNGSGYPYGVPLLGVFRDGATTNVVSELATEGDLFAWCGSPSSEPPGPAREAMVRPLARQMFEAVMQLHEMSIVHMDLSLENLLLTRRGGPEGPLQIQVIDYGMASTSRRFRSCVRGKPSYQAPEVHTSETCDGFLTDAFALGVTLYAALVKDYPWLSTRPGGCKCFEFCKRNGFRAYLGKRKIRGGTATVGSHLSESATRLLEGLLAFDPAERLCLGEAVWSEVGRPSVWEQPWVRGVADGQDDMVAQKPAGNGAQS